MRLRALALALLVAAASPRLGAQRAPAPFLSHLHATATSPVYTTYAAALERSRFLLDQGYPLRFHDPARPLAYTTDSAGDWGIGFVLDGREVAAVRDFAAAPVITVSYGDIVRYTFEPFPGIRVDATFLVYSSRAAVQELVVTNARRGRARLTARAWLVTRQEPFARIALDRARGVIRFRHREPADGWTIEHQVPHVADVQDALVFLGAPDRLASRADTALAAPGDGALARDSARALVADKLFDLLPGAHATWRMARALAPADSSLEPALAGARRLLTAPLESFIRADERLYRRIPAPPTADPDRQLLYWQAFTLLRQVMLPPEGAARHPYYVFSREPQWGWGHGGQVFHESLSMLAYVLMDPAGAMASQRIFAERQHADGYIPYRVGPYLEETIPYQGQLTTSAPWFAWESWEIYRSTRDPAFLRDMYASAARFYDWIAAHRDADGDGLYEWGGHAVLESVRDGDVAVWDQVGWPSSFEALDLNAMMVSEAESLDSMATALGRTAEAAAWRSRATALKDRIERTFWDDSTGFYYHVPRGGRGFTFKAPDDLKRREIIGFLPLWAGTASPERARRLIATLTDPARFWRAHGVPSLAADDPYYNAAGYWNGPVWVEWDYLIERGLLRYGRQDLARQLTDRVADGMIAQLRLNHVFWEMYGPDSAWAGHHQVYIWAGLIARMMLDAREPAIPPTTRAPEHSSYAKGGNAEAIAPGAAATGALPWHSHPQGIFLNLNETTALDARIAAGNDGSCLRQSLCLCAR